MRIFKDLFNGDEIGSDSYPLVEIGDILIEIQGKMIQISEGNYDIGANPSAEEPSEDFAADVVTECNVIAGHRLAPTTYDKKTYMSHIKAYMKRILDKLKEADPARAAFFQEKVQGVVKDILSRFSDFEFYTGESMDPEAMVILKFWKEDGITPFFYYFKDGLIMEKV